MKLRAIVALSTALLAPAASQAALSSYSQSFEALVISDPAALQNDGWLVYGNVFSPAHAYLYGYGPFPAPNDGAAFCAIDAGQGGPEQGAQQLSVYSDYNNTDHGNGNLIESNVFHEQTIGPEDVGNTWSFQFDAKRGNLAGASTAVAFIKTLDPNNGYALTNFITADMTAIPTTWANYWIAITIDAGLAGQILQFGFACTATNYEASAVFYDNLAWVDHLPADVAGGSRRSGVELRAAAPNPFRSSTRIEYALAEPGIADVGIFDIAGRRVATLFHGRADAGRHTAQWDGRSAEGGLAPTGVYQVVLNTPMGRRSRSLVLAR
jgi:hypothetical protein